jgi:hypothetical protein
MKRLFVCDNGYFNSKLEAKAHRDKVMKEIGEFKPIHLGPDHWRYGLKGNPRTHSHNAKSGGSGNGFPKSTRRFK